MFRFRSKPFHARQNEVLRQVNDKYQEDGQADVFSHRQGQHNGNYGQHKEHDTFCVQELVARLYLHAEHVNTASKCGFTPQYDGLEALYQKYASQGFVVIGFPCDQFGHQEPGSNEEIEEFCRLNHGVTFPLMAKSDVNGENANEVFKWLYSEKPFAGFGDSETGKFMDGMLSRSNPDYASNPDIKWNFTKFLIDRKGRVVARFEPVVVPEELESQIEALL